MKRNGFKSDRIAYKYEISYSQGVILFNLILGLFLIGGGLIFSLWIKSWWGFSWPLLGILSIWQAIKSFRQQGAQIKVSSQGIWSMKTGFLPWGKTLPFVKMEMGYRYVSTYLVLLNRFNQSKELARFSIRELDIDARILEAYINELAPKL
jgi:hypothetical protein